MGGVLATQVLHVVFQAALFSVAFIGISRVLASRRTPNAEPPLKDDPGDPPPEVPHSGPEAPVHRSMDAAPYSARQRAPAEQRLAEMYADRDRRDSVPTDPGRATTRPRMPPEPL